MLAGPPPTFSPGPLPTTMPPETQISSSTSSNRFRAPILPPNVTGNLRPPSVPPNFPNNQTVPTHPPPSSHNNIPTVSNGQQPFNSSGPMMNNGTNSSLASQSHFNVGPPAPLSSYPTVPSKTPLTKQYDNASMIANAYHPNLQPSQLPPPPPPNSQYPSLPNTNGVLSHTSNHYPRGPTPNYTSSSPSVPTEGQPTQPYYPNLVGPYANRPAGSPNQPGQPPPAPSTRIDPDMVPNVIQVLEQSQEKIQEPFITNAPGLLPPLVGTNFVCQDQGSCNPRLMRSTIYTIPNAHDLIKQSQIPLALGISPLANVRSNELEPPLANFGEIGPIRCHRCKAYLCSFMKFIDGGKRFTCCFCEAATDVPNEYFNHLDHTGRRLDCYQRPELCLGSYEVVATKQYCKDEKFPQTPAFIFMIDVSYNSVRSGLLAYICRILKDNLLDYLPTEKNEKSSSVRVGFVTYDKQIHFYNIKHTLTQPQMMVISDFEEAFVPLIDGFLCSPYESRGVINSLLDQIPQTFANTHETETILAPVIQSGIDAFKAANRCGKIFLFSTSLPNTNAPGKLTNRDDKKLLGTEKEKTLLAPVANNIYTKLGEDCAQNGCAVDLFAFPNSYYDLATIGEVCRLSGGEIYKFNYFSVENDGERLYDELKRNFRRTTAFDALMRVRTSSGIRPVDFLGNFYMTNATEMIFGTIDADKSVAIELKHDDKLPPDSNAYIQAALLYTSISGQRRLRILTLELTISSAHTSLYPACDLDTILNYITKVAVRSILISTPKSIRDNIIAQAANILACYRKYCAQATTSGQLILPETLKLLPTYIASLIKSDVLTGNQLISTDDRNWLIHRIMSLNIKGTSAYLYPRIYQLNNLDENSAQPTMIRCSYERLLDTGVYLLENGFVLYIWLGGQVDPSFVQYLFGIQSASQIQSQNCHIPDLDNPISKTIRTLLNNIRNERNSFMRFIIVQQRDSTELFFKNYLVEDKGLANGASYIDFLFHLHREIRNILS